MPDNKICKKCKHPLNDHLGRRINKNKPKLEFYCSHKGCECVITEENGNGDQEKDNGIIGDVHRIYLDAERFSSGLAVILVVIIGMVLLFWLMN